MIDEARIAEALSAVRDPELDEPITDLGFVKEIRINGGEVTVTLWLPTYFCAPNFAYIMAVDAKAAVGAIDGVTDVAIRLIDHHASDEINGGLAASKDFDETFPGETAGSGISGNPGIDDARLDSLLMQPRLEARREGLSGRQSVTGGEAIAEIEDHRNAPRSRRAGESHRERRCREDPGDFHASPALLGVVTVVARLRITLKTRFGAGIYETLVSE